MKKTIAQELQELRDIRADRMARNTYAKTRTPDQMSALIRPTRFHATPDDAAEFERQGLRSYIQKRQPLRRMFEQRQSEPEDDSARDVLRLLQFG